MYYIGTSVRQRHLHVFKFHTSSIVSVLLQTLSEAAEDMALSRIYLGIHWECDCRRELEEGKQVADYAYKNFH